MLVDTVRQFMEQEIIPHERETERLGEVPIELGRQIQKRSVEQGLYAANMPAEAGGGGLDFLSATLMDRELGKSTYGPGRLGRPPLGDPQRLPGRPARRLSAADREGRAQGGLRPHRAQRRLRRHEHPDPRPPRRRRLRHRRQQAFHHLRAPARLRHPVRRHRHRRNEEGPAQAHHRLPGRLRHARLRAAPRPAPGQPPHLSQLPAELQRLPRARPQHPGRGGQGLRPCRPVARQHPHPRRRQLLRQGRARAGRREQVGRHPPAVRPDHRQVPGRQLQAGGHGDRAARRRPADHAGRPGNTPPAP